MTSFATPQEQFWNGSFGDEYSIRNSGNEMIAANIRLFSHALRAIKHPIESCIEFGANIGNNLEALKIIYPNIKLQAVEINSSAIKVLSNVISPENIYHQSILNFTPKSVSELALIKLVLIHINPEMLPSVYESLYNSSNKYIFMCEYFNTQPMTVSYRGHSEKLFKRDFAGDLLDKYPDLKLIDYGFIYNRDVNSIRDDANWFLFEK